MMSKFVIYIAFILSSFNLAYSQEAEWLHLEDCDLVPSFLNEVIRS